MQYENVKLKSGYTLSRRDSFSTQTRYHRHSKSYASSIIQRSMGDSYAMVAIRRLCAAYGQTNGLSDRQVVDQSSDLVGSGLLHLHELPAADPNPLRIESPPASLSLSDRAKTLLKDIETLRLKPYDDQTGKTIVDWVQGATIGYGHLIKKLEWNTYKSGFTQKVADSLFDADAAPFIACVQQTIIVNLTQNQFDALVIFTFNIGRDPMNGFPGSSVAKLINDPKAHTQYNSLEAAWMAWNKSQDKVMEGLTQRRRCEWKIFSAGIYERW